jgi:hypothetical protein
MVTMKSNIALRIGSYALFLLLCNLLLSCGKSGDGGSGVKVDPSLNPNITKFLDDISIQCTVGSCPAEVVTLIYRDDLTQKYNFCTGTIQRDGLVRTDASCLPKTWAQGQTCSGQLWAKTVGNLVAECDQVAVLEQSKAADPSLLKSHVAILKFKENEALVKSGYELSSEPMQNGEVTEWWYAKVESSSPQFTNISIKHLSCPYVEDSFIQPLAKLGSPFAFFPSCRLPEEAVGAVGLNEREEIAVTSHHVATDNEIAQFSARYLGNDIGDKYVLASTAFCQGNSDESCLVNYNKENLDNKRIELMTNIGNPSRFDTAVQKLLLKQSYYLQWSFAYQYDNENLGLKVNYSPKCFYQTKKWLGDSVFKTGILNLFMKSRAYLYTTLPKLGIKKFLNKDFTTYTSLYETGLLNLQMEFSPKSLSRNVSSPTSLLIGREVGVSSILFEYQDVGLCL